MDGAVGVFGQNLDYIATLARDAKFRTCFASSRKLSNFAAVSDLKHGMFITEVLENVFLQIGPLFSQDRVSSKDREDIVSIVSKNLALLSSAYKEGDKTQAYLVLEDLQVGAIKFTNAAGGRREAARPQYPEELPPPVRAPEQDKNGVPELSDDARRCIEVLEASLSGPRDPNITAKDLDSMLAHCVDEKENSVELVRSVRDNP